MVVQKKKKKSLAACHSSRFAVAQGVCARGFIPGRTILQPIKCPNTVWVYYEGLAFALCGSGFLFVSLD